MSILTKKSNSKPEANKNISLPINNQLQKQLIINNNLQDDDLSSRNQSEMTEEIDDTDLTENQKRLLYLISLYSFLSNDPDRKDIWLRKSALIVLVYEGIVSGCLDYDYAPQSVFVQNRRIWMNVSQEGKSDVEFLREEELIYGLQIPSRSLQPMTCYQVSIKGLEIIEKISKKDKDIVHQFAYVVGSRELLNAVWDGRNYMLISPHGYKRRSTITDIEDVSFVSSAYIPQCLRYGGRPTLSNAHRAHESAISAEHIRDALDEVITLNSVSVIVAEFFPFGANNIVQLNINIGSTERNQGGFISAAITNQTQAMETRVEMNPELTSINILDYSLTNHVNFEAEINFANSDERVVQVETFGVSLCAEGTCFYGLQVEAVMSRIKDNISLDHLSRLLVTAQQDTSLIIDNIMSQYQKDILELIFLGDSENRNKVNLIIANEISPHLTAEEYMDKGEYENELKQVIGDTKSAYDISEHDVLIFGSHGLLVTGPNARHYEPLLCAYLQFHTIDIFLQNFFQRMWILSDDMQTTNNIILSSEKDPRSLERIQYRITRLSKDIILSEEILGYLLEALDVINIPPEPSEQAGRALYERLEIGGMRDQLLRRAIDVKKNIAGLHRFLDVLREMSAIVSETKQFKLSESVDLNTNRLCSLQDANERTSIALINLQYIFGGILAFQLLDRVTGQWTVADSPWFSNIYNTIIQDIPVLWFAISIILWGIIIYIFHLIYKHSHYQKQGITTVRCKINRRIFIDRLKYYLHYKLHSFEERSYEYNNDIVKITYIEGVDKHGKGLPQTMNKDITKVYPMEPGLLKKTNIWGGSQPIVTLEYDERNRYLLSVTIQYNRREANSSLVLTADDLRDRILLEFNEMNIWDIQGEDVSQEDLAVDRRAALQLILNEELQENTKHLQKHYPDFTLGKKTTSLKGHILYNK